MKQPEAQYKFADKQKIAEYLHDRGLQPGNATDFRWYSSFRKYDFFDAKDRCYTFLASD